MHVLVGLGALLWTAAFPVQNDAKLSGISQAYVAGNVVLIANRRTIEARALRDGSRRWSRRGIGLPVEVSGVGILAATPTGVAYLTANGAVRFRIRPCEDAKPPVAVALDTKIGVAVCQHTEAPYNLMRAVFFSLASGGILNTNDTTMPSHDFPIFGWHLANDRYGIRAGYSGATLTSLSDVLNLARHRVEDTTIGEDEAMQLALRAESDAKFCRHRASPGRQLRAGSFLVQTCGGEGAPLTVTVFGP